MSAECAAVAGYCVCKHDADHEGPHECEDTEKCGGAWEDRLGPFKIVRLPGAALGPVGKERTE